MIVKIRDESIKLGQFLKKIREISTGGESKYFLQNNDIKINGIKPVGRSTKIHVGDTIWINDTLIKVIKED
ncbi:RNA-binding S4 domain-containing protein [Mycoplasma sp. CSL10137]|uniref:RNA-binding S4 domain-containing protein n=1 Tax=unclassified Mycoplasma TaxID=2683645 RepID=UPI00197B7B40|nr:MULTISPECIES: RNA-binding S4 domain-containing protein [unclassified Mycoplasma]MBN4083652.1 RNA-binding S4 domain-containing protein [Mycoplasma sp. CSL10137]MBN4084063.1 RNA-binding S4 domain-containing protein [Mycoplasma sp. CSL10166]